MYIFFNQNHEEIEKYQNSRSITEISTARWSFFEYSIFLECLYT